uniref:Glucosamine inositolphosphorylceramide transferase 1 n=1 Tax=Kalanchoe fedtschenkoi TaxID=63787 RepID=A0A7N0TLU7_KALFE
MGSTVGGGVNSNNSSSGSNGGGGNSGCCRDLGLKWCRCKWWRLVNCPSLAFFAASASLLAAVSMLYAWIFISPYSPHSNNLLGCRPDGEGSWSIGVFYGDSPFSLKPLESMNVWKDEGSAWPVSNPVITCGLVSAAGFPSNFVADPFLYLQDDVLYMFYETKNTITLQGDIGVARSMDKGATWQPLGIALDEDWHLSYPYVFDHLGKIYMMPESSCKGELRLYQAVKFPLKWRLEKVILDKPLVDANIIFHAGKYWLFGSDHRGFGTKKNGELEIYYGSSPLGPWRPHKKNPIYNVDKSLGARNGGRPFIYNGNLYRVGQDCGETYGRRARVFKVELLNTNEFVEVEVPLGMEEPSKGRNAWNGARYHHLDAQQLSSGMWIAVVDGDRVPSGDSSRRSVLGAIHIVLVAGLVAVSGMLLGAVKCTLPSSWCHHNRGRRSNSPMSRERSASLGVKFRSCLTRVNRGLMPLRGLVKLSTCKGKCTVFLMFVSGVVLACLGVTYLYGGNGAHEAYSVNGVYSQFTMLSMSYDARLWNLKMYVKHYSRCSSVKEIVVVWNKGTPPDLTEFDSAVPIRIRVEKKNSLNNRFKIDHQISTRAVLELDDDIMMSCDDIERGFHVWREHPDRIVGFYPRLVKGSPLEYRGENFARRNNGYNMILTGAAFMDAQVAFQRYWSDAAKEGRMVVDKSFNCEDVLMNYLYANATSSRTVEYVKPAWAIDTSKFSSAAISRNTNMHYQIRSQCLMKFAKIYGSLSLRQWSFGGRDDGWDG